MADTVKIGCRVPSGLRLRASDWVKGPDGESILREVGMIELAGSGAHVAAPGGMQPEGDAVYTEVDGDLWSKWFEMNKDSDLVTSGAVFKGKANAKVTDPVAVDPVQDEADRQVAARDAADAIGADKAPGGPAQVADGKSGDAGDKGSTKTTKAA